ncbi:MAG TPA: CehA/McbA family metallohydrolase [Terriglobales bacterium]|nr:CehA/McbA family metallohydrolase [Terriglobales bacterium]
MRHLLTIAVLLLTAAGAATAQQRRFLEGEVPAGPETHFFLPFTVPEGIAEIEVLHSDLSSANILDWGLDDPNGFRGWGGGNSEPAIVGIDAASRSYLPGPIPAGTWEVVVGKAKIAEQPARYAVEVILRENPRLPAQSERRPYAHPQPLAREARWYAGDFHVHSRESGDARPAIEEVLQFAESRGLDFVMLSEHNTNSQLSLYAAAQATSANVLLLPGVEFTTYAGHANGIGATEWVDHRIGVRGATIAAAVEAFHQQGALFSVNHPRLRLGDQCIGCAWDHMVDPTLIDAVEIRTGIISGMSYWELIAGQGSHAAAIGGSDDHRAGVISSPIDSPVGSPTTMVFAEELSVEAILDGVREARTVVKLEGPDGPMIETEVSGERRGDTVYADVATLRATVTGGAGLNLRLFKNGEVLQTTAIDAEVFVHQVEIAAPLLGEDRYRFEVARNTAPVTVASYIWLQPADALPQSPSSNGEDGCTMIEPRRSPSLLLLMLAVAALGRARRRGGLGRM